MSVVRSVAYLAAAVAFGAAAMPDPAAAEQIRPELRRPSLESDADTNDARAYYALGVRLFDHDPKTAAAAFYWATRLEPGWAEALYARRLTGLMTNRWLLMRYVEGSPQTRRSAEALRLDSLEYRALRLNPFFSRDLDPPFYLYYVVTLVEDQVRVVHLPCSMEPGDAAMDTAGAGGGGGAAATGQSAFALAVASFAMAIASFVRHDQ